MTGCGRWQHLAAQEALLHLDAPQQPPQRLLVRSLDAAGCLLCFRSSPDAAVRPRHSHGGCEGGVRSDAIPYHLQKSRQPL